MNEELERINEILPEPAAELNEPEFQEVFPEDLTETAPAGEVSAEEETPEADIPGEEVSGETVPEETGPEEINPAENSPEDIPLEEFAGEEIPEAEVSEESDFEEEASEEEAVSDEVSKETVSDNEETSEEEGPSEEEISEEEISEEVPETEIPAEGIPEAEDSEEAAPEEESSEETVSDEELSEGETDEETASEEVLPEEIPEGLDAFGKRVKAPYHRRYYLLYGSKEESPGMDYAGTKAFLQDIGFDGGELRQARSGMDYAEINRMAESQNTSSMYCSYCGRYISGVNYFRLPDGRMRCTNCSRTLVKTKEELKSIYDMILANLESFFGAVINVPIAIEMLEERRLKKKLKRPISEVDDKSLLILGVAVKEGKKYSIYLENGAPRISVIATFAHELTHIWQYTHWEKTKNFPRCPKGKRLVIYEGMAKWVEIQYLYLIGEKAIAKREELFTRQRNDEYGIGFNLYTNEYPIVEDAQLCTETPFITDRYPINI